MFGKVGPKFPVTIAPLETVSVPVPRTDVATSVTCHGLGAGGAMLEFECVLRTRALTVVGANSPATDPACEAFTVFVSRMFANGAESRVVNRFDAYSVAGLSDSSRPAAA